MIALLTDFGAGSEYVGIMKGVIKGIAPDVELIDFCNNVSPQDYREGAWILREGFKFFPKKTVFLCVVDPGVGSERKEIAVKTKNYFFVGPDNGLMYTACKEDGIMEVRELRAPPSASKTFHGRDVFAKAAARIAVGEFSELGKKKSGMQKLEFKLDLRNREGEIVRIDSFGNILTNLPPVAGKKSYVVQTERQKMYVNFCETYARAPPDAFFVVRGSSGALEVSLKNGNAAEKLGVQSGERIVIK